MCALLKLHADTLRVRHCISRPRAPLANQWKGSCRGRPWLDNEHATVGRIDEAALRDEFGAWRDVIDLAQGRAAHATRFLAVGTKAMEREAWQMLEAVVGKDAARPLLRGGTGWRPLLRAPEGVCARGEAYADTAFAAP
mgnify:CR=1 FL=1